MELRESDYDLYMQLDNEIKSRPWGGESYESGGAAPVEVADSGDAADDDE